MSRVRRLLTTAAALSVALAAGGSAGRADRPGPALPAGGGLEADLTINRVPAHGCLRSGPDGGETIMEDAIRDGWTPMGNVDTWPTPAGPARVRGWRRGERVLLVVMGAGMVAAVECERDPRWSGLDGDAPGRDPAGWPRAAGLLRRLHVTGRGFEAAVYDSPAPAGPLLRGVADRLRRAGWAVCDAGPAGLFATRPGSPDLSGFAAPRGTESRLLVMTSESR